MKRPAEGPEGSGRSKANVTEGDVRGGQPEMEFEDAYADDFEQEVEADAEPGGGGEDTEAADRDPQAPKQMFRPGVDELQEGERLEHDPAAYIMYHPMRFNWPCLSFDFLPDTLGPARTRFPLTAFLVAGTQAGNGENSLEVVRLGQMGKTQVGRGGGQRAWSCLTPGPGSR